MSDSVEYGTTGKPHPFHLVRPSPWPMLSSFAAGLLAIGVVLYAHKVQWGDFHVGMKGIYIGLACVLACMFFWWKDVIFEAFIERAHSPAAKLGLRYGMICFIASEVMFFFAFFWAFFSAALMPVGGVWPPEGIHTIDPFDLPLLMTMILLLSGSTVTWAHHAMLEGDMKTAARALGITTALGAVFLGFQAYEYVHATFAFNGGIFPSAFYMATGFHGFHVLVGTIFLFVCWRRTKKGHFTKDSHFGFEAAAWYWHFVDVVWLFLFIAIYWWGGGGAEHYARHGLL